MIPTHFPLIKLPYLSTKTGNSVSAVQGALLPTKSIKYISVLGMLAHLQNSGKMANCTTVYGSSSGNMAIAAAFLCKLQGLQFIAVVDQRISHFKKNKIQKQGGQVIEVKGDVLTRIKLTRQLVKKNKNAIDLDQYSNPGSALAHFQLTGPWLHRLIGKQIDSLIAPLGTGGTFLGIASYLKKYCPGVATIPVDCIGSALISGRNGPRLLSGIGCAFIPDNVQRAYPMMQNGKPIVVSDQQAFLGARWLFENDGIGSGGSGGAAVVAVFELSKKVQGKNIVLILPDGPESYPFIFDDAWMQRHNFLN